MEPHNPHKWPFLWSSTGRSTASPMHHAMSLPVATQIWMVTDDKDSACILRTFQLIVDTVITKELLLQLSLQEVAAYGEYFNWMEATANQTNNLYSWKRGTPSLLATDVRWSNVELPLPAVLPGRPCSRSFWGPVFPARASAHQPLAWKAFSHQFVSLVPPSWWCRVRLHPGLSNVFTRVSIGAGEITNQHEAYMSITNPTTLLGAKSNMAARMTNVFPFRLASRGPVWETKYDRWSSQLSFHCAPVR